MRFQRNDVHGFCDNCGQPWFTHIFRQGECPDQQGLNANAVRLGQWWDRVEPAQHAWDAARLQLKRIRSLYNRGRTTEERLKLAEREATDAKAELRRAWQAADEAATPSTEPAA